jgi:putative AlgH/UPF0301 family transcriptional regulator
MVDPGTLLIAPRTEDTDALFARAVVLILDAEPTGITSGIVLNRPTEWTVLDTSALALLFVPDPTARVFWGGPMGEDPAILAEFSSTDGLEWFHLPKEQLRPFPLPAIGVIAVAEHPQPFEHRLIRTRVFVGLCVWDRNQLECELERGEWTTRQATADDVFADAPEMLWQRLVDSQT